MLISFFRLKTYSIETKMLSFLYFGSKPRLLHQKTNNENNKQNNLGHYLAGLIEGDGSIIVPKTFRNEKGKLLYPVVKITFVYKDLALAKKIQEVLRSGTIVHPSHTKYVDFLVQNIETYIIITLVSQEGIYSNKSKDYFTVVHKISRVCYSSKSSVNYTNADTQKKSILNDNKGKAGVYRWKNIDSGKMYVGSSVDLYRRFLQYYNIKYITRVSKSSLISRALLKHGYSKFELDILEICDPSIVIEREQYYIDILKPDYNILQVAGSLFGYKHTEESLAKMKQIALNRSDETKAKLREAALGKTYNHTEETKMKLRNAILGKKHTEETREKLRIIHSNRVKHPVPGIKIKVNDTQTKKVFLYDSLRFAATKLNSNHKTISNYLQNGKLLHDRYKLSKCTS